MPSQVQPVCSLVSMKQHEATLHESPQSSPSKKVNSATQVIHGAMVPLVEWLLDDLPSEMVAVAGSEPRSWR